MKAVFFIKKENYGKVKDLVSKDDLISRQSLVFRDNQSLNLKEEGYYLEIEGNDEAIKKAREILKDLAKELEGEEKEKILETIKNQEESAMSGFGAIFG